MLALKQTYLKKSVLLTVFFLIILSYSKSGFCQKLKPGFSKKEYIELLKINLQHADSSYTAEFPYPEYFNFIYRSPELGLQNRWDLWVSKDSVAVISIRGTVKSTASWLENYYAAMVSASGKLILSQNDTFCYHLSEDKKAGVHVGWLIGMAFLSKDIVPKIDSCIKNGIYSFLIIGHSQGGAISFLLTSYLHQLKKENKIPEHVQFKTYSSAAPKPGNLYYAYTYENLVKSAWGFTIVNTFDWVPETPVAFQTIKDFNETNPFESAKSYIKKLPFPKNIIISSIFNGLKSPFEKAEKRFVKRLGNNAGREVEKLLPGFIQPDYLETNNYVRTGTTIALTPDPTYFELFPEKSDQIFIHHTFKPYLYLINNYP
jgi:hypothetical protein